MAEQVGQEGIRGENVERAVKGFALKQYKMKQVCLVQKSNKWTETFYRETATPLTGLSGAMIKGVPRLAEFPNVDPSWTKFQGEHIKHAAKTKIPVEDVMTDAIDVQSRALIRVTESITNSVDLHIYAELTGATGIGTAAAGSTWNNPTKASRDPIDDILAGIQAIDEENYDALSNGYLLLSPKDHRSLITNSKVINNPSFKTADVVSNGKVGQICGLNIIKSTTVDADEAMIIIGQRAATWKSAQALKSAVELDPLIKYTISASEIGQVQVTDPKAIYVITNTQE